MDMILLFVCSKVDENLVKNGGVVFVSPQRLQTVAEVK